MKEDSRTLAADLAARLERLVAAARKEGREQALAEVRQLVAGAVPARRGPGRPPKSAAAAPPARKTRKSRKPRKNPWASMTAEQKADRVRKMLAGRGLKPKSE
jgi:hypothetical protein